MEGHVFDIGNDTVAKIWFAKEPDEIVALQSFYEVVLDLHLPFDTPQIMEVIDTPEGTISVERALWGTRLSDAVFRDEEVPPTYAITAVMSVLDALRNRPVPTPQSSLPILGLQCSTTMTFGGSILTLLAVASRNVERYGDQLRQKVEDFDWVYRRIVQQVSALSDTELCAVHGDLCPPNILLRPDWTVGAVIDWGFLSHFGDTAFDATIACGSYNLYGEHFRRNDDYLTSTCIERHGFDLRRLLVYRSLYALLTSNAYSEEGTDGHHEWCVGNLNRQDVRAALA